MYGSALVVNRQDAWGSLLRSITIHAPCRRARQLPES
jgi:hypothetical protein